MENYEKFLMMCKRFEGWYLLKKGKDKFDKVQEKIDSIIDEYIQYNDDNTLVINDVIYDDIDVNSTATRYKALSEYQQMLVNLEINDRCYDLMKCA